MLDKLETIKELRQRREQKRQAEKPYSPAREELLAFAPVVFPNYLLGRHIIELAGWLERIAKGEQLNLIITMPPRHGKSRLTAGIFCPWYLGRNPDKRIIYASYGDDLAKKWSREARAVVDSEAFSSVFPEVYLSKERSAVDEWDVLIKNSPNLGNRGGFKAVGVDGPVTGHGGNVLIVDDPVKNRKEAESQTVMDSVWAWYQGTFRTRLQPGASIIVIQTRWIDTDLTGRLLKLSEEDPTADQFHQIHFPAMSEDDIPLWPQVYDKAALNKLKASVGPYEWAAQYQGDPQPREGGLIKRAWLENNIVKEPPSGLRWYRFWDLAIRTQTKSDYTCSGRGAMNPATGDIYIADVIHDRLEWPEVYQLIKATAKAERPTVVGVEANGFQMAGVQQLLREPELIGVAVLPVTQDTDKLTRALPFQARACSGKIKLVAGQWNQPFIQECTRFPQGSNDDYVDMAAGVLGLMQPTSMLDMKVSRPTIARIRTR